jgi:hypothetical protein
LAWLVIEAVGLVGDGALIAIFTCQQAVYAMNLASARVGNSHCHLSRVRRAGVVGSGDRLVGDGLSVNGDGEDRLGVDDRPVTQGARQ